MTRNEHGDGGSNGLTQMVGSRDSVQRGRSVLARAALEILAFRALSSSLLALLALLTMVGFFTRNGV